jgi:hypothetical protein
MMMMKYSTHCSLGYTQTPDTHYQGRDTEVEEANEKGVKLMKKGEEETRKETNAKNKKVAQESNNSLNILHYSKEHHYTKYYFVTDDFVSQMTTRSR